MPLAQMEELIALGERQRKAFHMTCGVCIVSCSPQQRPSHSLSRLALAWRQCLEAGHMAGGAHYTLAHAETRHKSVMAATLHIIVKAEPLGRLRSTVVRRILLWTWLARLGRSPAARAGAPGRK